MRSNLKYIFFWVLTFFFNISLCAQSKKEQLITLTNQVDSLNTVFCNELSFTKGEISFLNLKLDSAKNSLNDLKKRIEKLKRELFNEDSLLYELNLKNREMQLAISIEEVNNLCFRLRLDSNKESSFDIEMVFVKGGTFLIGSNSGDSIERPVHSVTLSSFGIGKFKVTQFQWKALMGYNPSRFGSCDNCPVDQVSWEDAQEYIRRLNEKTGENYRLPTEAEWEYAARGGENSKGYKYSGSNDLNTVAWVNFGPYGMHEVGRKKANELGVYDMSGPVLEWCYDRVGAYKGVAETNPMGPSDLESFAYREKKYADYMRQEAHSKGESIRPEMYAPIIVLRIQRGGCYSNSHRLADPQESRGGPNGFRLVLPVSP